MSKKMKLCQINKDTKMFASFLNLQNYFIFDRSGHILKSFEKKEKFALSVLKKHDLTHSKVTTQTKS